MEKYDILIIGAGPAGVTAAIYAHRANLNYLILEKSAIGGKVITAYEVENYPGFSKILGSELVLNLRKQIKDLVINFKREEVLKIEKFDDSFFVSTNKDRYEVKRIIIATGTSENKLNLEKEEQFLGRGVSFCATCDGAFYKDKDVIVYGGGDSAVTEAAFLAGIAKSVTVISRHQLRAESKNIEALKAHTNVSYIPNSVVTEILGDNHFEGVTIRTNETEEKNIFADGIFVYIGSKPSLKYINYLNILDEKGYIITDSNFRTPVKNVYAIGDCIDKDVRQIVTATSDGARVIHTIQNDMKRD